MDFQLQRLRTVFQGGALQLGVHRLLLSLYPSSFDWVFAVQLGFWQMQLTIFVFCWYKWQFQWAVAKKRTLSNQKGARVWFAKSPYYVDIYSKKLNLLTENEILI